MLIEPRRARQKAVCMLAVLAALATGAAGAWGDNWPTWRGPSHDGVSREKGVPATWSETKNIAWKLTLPGMGMSTPVVWDNRIFLTSARGQDLVLLCVGTDGKLVWERKLGSSTRDVVRREGGIQANEACASCTTDGKRVWALVGSGDLGCFDVGRDEIWRCNIQERYGKYNIYHGIHFSPLVHKDRVYLALLHSAGQWVVALDKNTGKEIWKLARPSDAKKESREAYTSPIIWNTGKDEHLIIHGGDYTTAHRLDDGSEVWRLPLNEPKKYLEAFRMIATPIATPEMLIIPTTKNFSRGKGGPVIALKPGAEGGLIPGGPFELWRVPTGVPDVASPLYHDGLLYLCQENGFLVCADGKTGKELYQERLPDARYRASPVYADGNVYVTGYQGTVTVVKAGPKFDVLAENELSDTFAASPAIANGRIYLRGFKTLYCVGPGNP
jgi:outer membrane protein assembly factor BamB